MRYAANWDQFGQLNWNLNDSERVEGYSSSFYMILAYIALKLSISPILILKITSIIAFLATLFLIYSLTQSNSNRWFALLAVVFYSGYYGTIWWTVSGLETATYVFSVVLSAHLFLSSQKTATANPRKLLAYCSFVIFIAGVVRPEGPVIGILLGIYLLAHGLSTKKSTKNVLLDILFLAIPFIICYGTYFMVRYSYFGEFWPNTFYVKTAYSGDPWQLIKMFFNVATLPFIFGFVGFFNRNKRSILLFLYIYIVCTLGLLYGVDPIIAYHNRHSTTALVALVIIFSFALHESFVKKPRLAALLIIILSIGQLATSIDNIGYLKWDTAFYQKRMTARVELAHYLNTLDIKNYAIGDAGIIPYLTLGKYVYDYYGLNSKVYSAKGIDSDIARYSQWLLQKMPDAIIFISIQSDELIPRNIEQQQLISTFTEEQGYIDAGVNFGALNDEIQYWVFLKK